ncbi:zinc-dependent metalloprotease [Bdellovibrio sp. SKB1291214]|uniref:zinc-dependent metalloprotease n=1 Tax=Bdellovibrio sp. SKB1291214 TaxID=1732569 RepID=UPI000B51C8A1|nr:zinc-dependent metalloprotease [Bdellovibrio sp. SKB1291214]UYL09843.1 zinc-dependent metalloprotease [Bdellovibrio sp. SKB1291214]
MKSNIRRKIPVTGALLLAISSVMISCTKEVPYKQVYKENVETKAALSPDDEYLFVASSDLSGADDAGVASAQPYWQGQEKIVKFRFTENTLQVLQVNEESKLAKDNTLNDKVLMEIPIKNVEYRCSEDRYGKCTNKEEENSELNWSKKTKFIPDFNGMKTTGFSLLPVEMQQLYGMSCYTETSSRFLSYELKDDSLNIQVEKSFRGNPECLGSAMYSVNSVDDLQSQIIYHYSFNKLSKVTSPGYKAINYPLKDQNTFGFFTSENRKYDVDFNRSLKNQKEWMNRWNPERKEIVYFLSDNFDKPQYKSIKEATQVAFDRVNEGLKAAGLETRLVLKDPAHKQVGDTRNSMIVMVEDPVAGGPLGYGPTVANPRTGEIISGRVAMYYGNFVQGVRYTYDEVVRELSHIEETESQGSGTNAAAQAKAAPSEAMKNKIATDKYAKWALTQQTGYKIANSYVKSKSAGTAMTPNKLHNVVKEHSNLSALSRKQIREVVANTNAGKSRYKTQTTLMAAADADEGVTQKDASKVVDALSVMSKYCNYPSELFPFSEYIKTALQGKLGKKLKLWNDLSEDERAQVIAIVMPEIWVPTLVHELGHNLGLRHNFQGSEDRMNFYTQGELAKMGVKHEIPYSSVMDYGYSELNLLPTLGKYDIAALRFGYKRVVQTENGGSVEIPETLEKLTTDKKELALRDFSYCSDEGVDANPGCKRFDKGTNYTEIVQYLIKAYDDSYATRNFRNGRENFSKVQTGGYYSGNMSRFQYIRNFFETYSNLKNRFGLTDDSPEWETIPWLKDLKQATLISGRFFVRVLQTPEVMCAYAMKEEPNKIVDVTMLRNLSADAISCADVEQTDKVILVAQAGKFFNDQKDPKTQTNYADQIDVRGIGPDKLAAAQALFARSTYGTNNHEDNYMDVKDLSTEIASAVTGILFDQNTSKITFRDNLNQPIFDADWSYQLFITPDMVKRGIQTHWFEVPLVDSAARRMGLPNHKVSFQQMLLNTIQRRMGSSQTHHTEDKAFVDQFRVNRIAKTSVINSDANATTVDNGTFKAVALTENALAQNAMVTMKKNELLTKLPGKDLEGLLVERNRPANIPRSTNHEPVVAAATSPEYAGISANDIKMFKAGSLPSNDKLMYLLTILPGADDTK